MDTSKQEINDALLRILNEKVITNTKYFTRGKRGVLFKAKLNRKTVVIKTKRQESKASGRMENEAHYLELLNKHKIGPKFLFSGENFLVYEFVKGDFIEDWIESHKKKEIITIIKSVITQMRKLDLLNINKEEMHNPIKHILVNKKAVLIDFERAHISTKPKNVTQFCQYLRKERIQTLLKGKKIKIQEDKLMELSQRYKHTLKDDDFQMIMRMII